MFIGVRAAAMMPRTMMATDAPELHDAILLCAGIAAVYLVVAWLQLRQLKRPRLLALRGLEPSVGLDLALAPKADEESFAGQLRQRSLEAELKRLGQEVDRLREELRAAQDDIKLLRSERAIATVTPLYNEAMSFAKRGINAAGIATQCGISMGEAELVAALAGKPQHDERQNGRYRAAA